VNIETAEKPRRSPQLIVKCIDGNFATVRAAKKQAWVADICSDEGNDGQEKTDRWAKKID
jgi:hypothetical protein